MSLTESDTTDQTVLAPPTAEEIASIDAWWRANNYLTIGQIYLQDNPLLREPLAADAHQAAAARPLGHQPRPVVHLRPRVAADPAHRSGGDLPGRSRSRRSGAGRGRLPRGHLHRDLPRRSPRTSDGHAAAVPAVLQPRRHPEPRVGDHARLDPRGRRARLRPGARVRRGDGQPRPARASPSSATARPRPGRWRARGRASPSSTRPATARCCRSCTSTAPRSPGRPCSAARTRRRSARLLEGHGYDVIEVEGDDLPGMHHRFAAALADGLGRIRAIQRAARGGDWDGSAPALAADRPAHARRAGPGRTRSTASRSPAPGARTRCRCPACKDNPEHLRDAGDAGCARTGPRSCSTTTGAPDRAGPRRQPRRRPADERVSPHANGGLLTARPRPARTSATTPSTCRRPAPQRAESTRPARRADARHLPRATPTGSGCSAPTRPTATGSAPSSRCPTGRSRSGSTADDVELSPRRPGDGGALASTTATAGSRATP